MLAAGAAVYATTSGDLAAGLSAGRAVHRTPKLSNAGNAAGSGVAGAIFTIAGNGEPGVAGDGGPATAARLGYPVGIAVTSDGGFLIADAAGVVRRVVPEGIISTVAGSLPSGAGRDYGGDLGPATSALLSGPAAIAMTADGGFLITGGNRVRRVAPDGIISTVAGGGESGFAGDGGPATAARLDDPAGLAVTADGGFLIADSMNGRVRRVAPDGTISTVAGNGQHGFAGDGGPATAAQLNNPSGIAVTADGGFLIADTTNARVRRVAPDGRISTVAGNGKVGFAGDGGPATAAQLSGPSAVAVTPDGGFLIADTYNNRIRRVSPDGTISTVAGNGKFGSADDGDVATAAEIDVPTGVAMAADGGMLIATPGRSDDPAGRRVRYVAPADPALLALALRPLAARAALGRYDLPVMQTRPASLQWELLARGRQPVRRGTSVGPAGLVTVMISTRGLVPGTYLIRLTGRSASARVATQAAWAFLGGRLPPAWARSAARSISAAQADFRVVRCQVVTRVRVDCQLTSTNPYYPGCHDKAILLASNGQLYARDYGFRRQGCPRALRFERNPKWRGKQQLVALERLAPR